MTRANLDDLPEFALPSGFTLRRYQPGDGAHWLRLHRVADQFNQITPELFRKQFGSDGRVLSERQSYLFAPTGEVIGTGTAWFNDNFAGAPWGRVHWMAVLPEFQGRGLGKALLSAICRRLRELGHERACLTTATARAPAVGLYLRFGFEPLIRSAEDERAWHELMRVVKP